MQTNDLHLTIALFIFQMCFFGEVRKTIYFYNKTQFFAIEIGYKIQNRFLSVKNITCLLSF